jgi:hypothetical protein
MIHEWNRKKSTFDILTSVGEGLQSELGEKHSLRAANLLTLLSELNLRDDLDRTLVNLGSDTKSLVVSAVC